MVLRSGSVWRPAARRTFEISRGLRHIDQKGCAGGLLSHAFAGAATSPDVDGPGVYVVCVF